MAKETYLTLVNSKPTFKRGLSVEETDSYGERGLLTWQKRPI